MSLWWCELGSIRRGRHGREIQPVAHGSIFSMRSIRETSRARWPIAATTSNSSRTRRSTCCPIWATAAARPKSGRCGGSSTPDIPTCATRYPSSSPSRIRSRSRFGYFYASEATTGSCKSTSRYSAPSATAVSRRYANSGFLRSGPADGRTRRRGGAGRGQGRHVPMTGDAIGSNLRVERFAAEPIAPPGVAQAAQPAY